MRPRCPLCLGMRLQQTTYDSLGSESCVASAGGVTCVVDVKLGVTTRNFAVCPGIILNRTSSRCAATAS